MTRRTNWPEQQDGGGPTSSRAEAGPPRSPRGARRRDARGEAADTNYRGGDGGREREETADSEGTAGSEEKDPAERARAICLRLITGTPRTRHQLAEALRKHEISDDVAEQVLSRFEEVGLIDDVAFADAWVESRHHSRGLARRALARELRTKGVDSGVIDEAVGQLDLEQEVEAARVLVERKLRATRGLDQQKRIRRLAGMLARKGYGEGMALRVVRQALEEEGEDPELLEQHLSDD